MDDHELIRRGLRELLSAEEDMEVAGEAGNVRQGRAGIATTQPDVAIVDLRLPDGDGVALCRDIRAQYPAVRVLMLTSAADQEAVMNSVMAGADGFLVKGAEAEIVVDGIRSVAAGGSLLDPATTRAVLERVREKGSGLRGQGTLTEQEHRVLELLAEGLTNREIAARLHLAEKTVRNYVSNLLHKLGMKHRTEAALYAAGRRRSSPPAGD